MVNVNMGVGLTGHFIVEKWSKKRGTRERIEFDNLVLDVGWTNLKDKLQNGGVIRPEYLYLGTGTTEPSSTDTGLEAVSGTLPGKQTATYYTSGFTNDYSDVGGWIYHQCTMEFAYGEGEAEGTWTELGLAYGSSYTEPYNRSLFRDTNGNPISLTILSDEYLTVYVQLRMYFDAAEKAGTFNYNGASAGYTYGMTVYRGSAWASDAEEGSIFFYGLPKYTTLMSYPDDYTATGLGLIYDWGGHMGGIHPVGLSVDPDLTLTRNYVVDPGSNTADTYYGLIFRGGDSNGGGIWIVFDTPISKTDEEKFTGSCTIQFSRDQSIIP